MQHKTQEQIYKNHISQYVIFYEATILEGKEKVTLLHNQQIVMLEFLLAQSLITHLLHVICLHAKNHLWVNDKLNSKSHIQLWKIWWKKVVPHLKITSWNKIL